MRKPRCLGPPETIVHWWYFCRSNECQLHCFTDVFTEYMSIDIDRSELLNIDSFSIPSAGDGIIWCISGHFIRDVSSWARHSAISCLRHSRKVAATCSQTHCWRSRYGDGHSLATATVAVTAQTSPVTDDKIALGKMWLEFAQENNVNDGAKLNVTRISKIPSQCSAQNQPRSGWTRAVLEWDVSSEHPVYRTMLSMHTKCPEPGQICLVDRLLFYSSGEEPFIQKATLTLAAVLFCFEVSVHSSSSGPLGCSFTSTFCDFFGPLP